MKTLGLYVRTVRHLRPMQIVNRARRKLVRNRPDLREAPPPRPPSGRYSPPIAPPSSLIGPETFRFLGVERRCAAPADWQPADVAKLWEYNLHYFDDLNACDAHARAGWHEALIDRWIRENPPGRGCAWDPYPVSKRIVNWVKWAARGHELAPAWRASLAVQARWLERRLEFHLLGNHLLMNAKALIHAGLYFHGAEAETWYRRGRALLDRELQEQVLPDGAHFELSPMYHAAALEDLLDLVNVLRAYGEPPPPAWNDYALRMFVWLGALCHPDGEIAFFNDAAFGIAPTNGQLRAYAVELGVSRAAAADAPTVLLEPSGYARASLGAACLICDCAAIGPDHLPAHAHADSLSFELSVARQRIFVNSGTSRYGNDPERTRQRGTAAHNTVLVDDRDSSEVWGGFRVARRARVLSRSARAAGNSVKIEASHDGYRRLGRKTDHARRWTLGPDSLEIEDVVSGPFDKAESYLHLHPDVGALATGARVQLEWDGGRADLTFSGCGSVRVEPSTWHPRFGEVVPNKCIVATMQRRPLVCRVDWAARG